jgi:A/G-specific adenine glycosylase
MTPAQFRRVVYSYYKRRGRHTLPWRQTHDPYCIMVSELMLQQTQVPRVIPKYEAFINKFPTVGSLARAELGTVLVLWQGLGYNRRAKLLHSAARAIMARGGIFPQTKEGLEGLPGVGPYTASAILAFAYNTPTALIETNVRTVYIHHFFVDKTVVTDSELLPLIEKTMDTKNPRAWYAALMDYGSHLKQTVGNVNKKSAQYVRQSKFKGSSREVRGAIVRLLTQKGLATVGVIVKETGFTRERIELQLRALLEEGLIQKNGQRYSL